jgi:hypothetical protein
MCALKTSIQGLEIVDKARKRRGWIKYAPAWCDRANVAEATLKRFWRRVPIRDDLLASICQAVGVKWEEVVDLYDGASVLPRWDWEDGIDVSTFYGRTKELATLEQWILQERCRLVALQGMGGIGKTALATKLGERIKGEFEYVIQRSLRQAPLSIELLADLIEFLSEGQENDGNVSRLIEYLRQHRCLIVLDDWEAIIGSGDLASKYREGYEDYGELLERVGEESHKSCLLLLSREKPVNIEPGEAEPVRSKKLKGLQNEEAKDMLQSKGLCGAENRLEELIRRYKGNPFALKIVSKIIQIVFSAKISHFLDATTVFIPDVVVSLLNEQFEPLSALEKDIIYWLAVRRNSASFTQLQKDILQPVTTDKLIDALVSLMERRSLIDSNEEESLVLYTLEPVMMKYITNNFIEKICDEIFEVSESQRVEGFDLIRSHCIITSQNQDNPIKREQIRLIIKPVQEILCAEFRSRRKVEEKLSEILSLLQHKDWQEGYAQRNILAIMSELKS